MSVADMQRLEGSGHYVAVTPDDDADLPSGVTRGLYAGVLGDVKVDSAVGDSAVVWTALAAGYIHPIRAKRVYATGTTATNFATETAGELETLGTSGVVSDLKVWTLACRAQEGV